MPINIVSLLVSASFFVIVITLHYESIRLMVHLFAQKVETVCSDETSNIPTPGNVFTSSILCHKYDNRKFCTFKNLCYAPFERQFIFILTNNSVLSGVTSTDDLKSIELSSVKDHNALFMKLAVVTSESRVMKRNITMLERGYILWRFKWDNIMHVIHDDVLPLFSTYSDICFGNVDECIHRYQLAFADEGEAGPFSEWYNMFSSPEPIFLHKRDAKNVICFGEARTGLTTRSLWFQYGFGVPQGPLKNALLEGNHIRRFSAFVLQKFRVSLSEVSNSSEVVFFSRKINRKILNEETVVKEIEDVYGSHFPGVVKVHNMDVATNDTRSMLTRLMQARAVVGMHGSAMVLCLFLQPGAAVVELFPFAINPRHVSPTKALCELPNIGLVYSSWVNSKEENSVAHVDAPPLLGGIAHLPPSEQQLIQSASEVPAVQCCHNPTYLYRMFQDTLVHDLDAVLHEGFSKQKSFDVASLQSDVMQWQFPAPVMNVTCRRQGRQEVVVSWMEPLNAVAPLYLVAVAASGIQFSTTSDGCELILQLPAAVAELDVWIKCLQHGQESLDTFARCRLQET